MPFAGYENFDACVVDQLKRGNDAESARKICGALEAGTEKRSEPVQIPLMLEVSVKSGAQAVVEVTPPPAAPTATKRETFDLTSGRILKAAEETVGPLHYVLSVVLEPNPEDDTQGDTYDEEDVWDARRTFAKSQQLNLMHAMALGKGVDVLDNWITPIAFEYSGQAVKKGSWLVGAEVDEREQPELWAGIKSGAITTWSIEGDGVRTPLDEESAQAAA